jgi:hypothetical protein
VVDDTHAKIPFANTDEFYHQTGLFYFVWTRTDLVIDWAFWKALKTATPEQAHERVAGLSFGRKCAEFRTLLLDSKEFENIEKVRSASAHHQRLDAKRLCAFVSCLGRRVRDIHSPKERGSSVSDWHTFTRAEFLNHVHEFIQLSVDFQTAVGVSDWDLAGFAAAARPSKPTPPSAPE